MEKRKDRIGKILNNLNSEKSQKRTRMFVNKKRKKLESREIASQVYGNISNASSIYNYDKFSTPRGHGFAAEYANHVDDKLKNFDLFGEKVRLVGDEIDPKTNRIRKNGADRIVKGVAIQTKYCKSGAKCIAECFSDGKFKYFIDEKDKIPMKIEVPSDMYDDAIKALQERIKKGEIDLKDASSIIIKGKYTYQQVKNIAKAGNIDSIIFDSKTGAITSLNSGGLSIIISYATAKWQGENSDRALKIALKEGLKTYGTNFFTSVISSQFAKSGFNSLLVGSSEKIIKLCGPKISANIVNAFRGGKNIYGAAAMKSASKMLRNNVITAVASIVVLSTVDVVNTFRGKLSKKQLFRNITNTTANVGGGTIGWIKGASIGSFAGPVGTVVGGLAGSYMGGKIASTISEKVLDNCVVDQNEIVLKIIENNLIILTKDYLLNQKELEEVSELLSEYLTEEIIKELFENNDREQVARDMVIAHIEIVISKRENIQKEQFEEGVENIIAELDE